MTTRLESRVRRLEQRYPPEPVELLVVYDGVLGSDEPPELVGGYVFEAGKQREMTPEELANVGRI